MIQENQLNIEHQKINGIECLFLKGFLDAHTAPELENSMSELIKEGSKNILVNFKELEYISSAGLGVFMEFIEDLRKTGGDIKMAEMQAKVFSVFDLLGFPMLFDILSNQDDAINKFEVTGL
jgi:anti-sigma B factor antagonist